MNKNNSLSHKFLERSNIALVCILGMVCGLLVSRALMSMSIIAFGVNALYKVHPRRWFQDKWWFIGAIWVCFYAFSALWGSHTGFWDIRFNEKLPILLLPLSFTFLPAFSAQQLRIYTVCIGIMLFLGACYSCSFLVNNLAFYMEQYRVSKVLPTPADGDHIRFSVSIALYITWCVYIWPTLKTAKLKWIIGTIALLLTIYLHILAAKSGLISLYLFIISYGIWQLMQKKIKAVLTVVALLAVLLVTANFAIPTFRQRIMYMCYTYIAFEQGDRSGTYGDIGRLISYKIAAREIIAHPWAGVGASDMLDVMKQGYTKWYPQVRDEDRLLPHNQFLAVALGCGIPAALLFTCWVFMPLGWLKRDRNSFFMFTTWLILSVNLMIEPFLEVQYGVFVYLFFMLWQRMTLKKEQRPAIVDNILP